MAGALTNALGKPGKGTFDLSAYKTSRGFDQNTKFKPQEYFHVSPALCEILSIPGIPQGHITLIRGHSNTGKTTILTETAIAAQKQGILPVLIMTEMKWNWERAEKMGLDPDFCLYIDGASLNTIEDVAAYMHDRMTEQKNGKLPYSLCFLWDSLGTIPCLRSVESKNNNSEWNAGAISTQFGNFLNQQFGKSRKEGYPYTNSLVLINHIWVEKPSMPGTMPKMKNKGGETMFRDSTLVITMGGVTSAGITRLKAQRKGQEIEFGFEVRVSIDKNHITGANTRGKLYNTEHGLIKADKDALDAYKKEYSASWLADLGGDDFEIVGESEDGKKELIESEE